MMTAHQDIPVELHVKICKKIAQLTKVIYTLNSRAEEQNAIIDKLKDLHESDLSKVMNECKEKVLKFKLQTHRMLEKEQDVQKMHRLFDEVKAENENLQETLKEHIGNASLNEKQLKIDYENKYLDLQNKFLERKREYDELVESFHSFKQETLIKQEQKVAELTMKYNDEIKSLASAHQEELNGIINRGLQSEQKINEKMTEWESLHMQWEIEKKKLEAEHEAKINKMKSFYEKEMGLLQSEKVKGEVDKWEKQKVLMLEEFQLVKSELSNRNRFLEKNLSLKEDNINKYKLDIESLQLKLNSNVEAVSSIELQLKEKVVENASLGSKVVDLQQQIVLSEQRMAQEVYRKDGMYIFFNFMFCIYIYIYSIHVVRYIQELIESIK